MNRTALLITAALVLAAMPAATAEWYGQGTVEPDTEKDFISPHKWENRDISPTGARIYFNAFQTQYLTGINPNAQATHTTAPVVHIHAMIGVWKDCNNDGYVGMAEGSLEQYRRELLDVDTMCPESSMFNDGEWITEFMHVGPTTDNGGATTYATNIINASTVKIWGDLGKPGDPPGYSCSLFPGTGSTASTGGMLRYADCTNGKSITRGINDADAILGLGIGFGDAPESDPQHSNSPLNVRPGTTVWGSPYNSEGEGLLKNGGDEPAFTTMDCSNPNEVRDPTTEDGRGDASQVVVADPTGGSLSGPLPQSEGSASVTVFGKDTHERRQNVTDEDGNYVVIGTPAPALGSPTGSYADALNNTETGAIQDCDTSGPNGSNAGNLADASNPETELVTDNSGKREAGSLFTFNDGSRAAPELQDALGEGAPSTLSLLRKSTVAATPGWSSSTIITSEEFYLTPERGLAQTRYFSFYASIDPAEANLIGTLPAGASRGTYGDENCDANGNALNGGGWNCNAAAWYINPLTGQSYDTPDTPKPRVGDAYDFRDVDCFNGVGVCGTVLQD